MLHSIWQQVWKTQQSPQDWKRTVFIPSPKKYNVKESSNYCTNLLFHMPVSLWVKSFKLGFSSISGNFQMYKLGLKKAEEQPVTKLSTFVASWRSKGIWEKKKKSTSASLTVLKPLTGWTTKKCGKFLRDGNTIPPYQSPEKPVCRSRSNSENST